MSAMAIVKLSAALADQILKAHGVKMPGVNRFEMEHLIEVWDNDAGEKIEVGPDRDGNKLVELRLRNKDGGIVARLTMPPPQAALVAQGIYILLKELADEGKPTG